MPNIIFNIPYHICNSSLSRIWLVDLSANILASNFLSMRIWRNKGKRLSRNLSHTLAQCLVAMELVEILQYLFFGSLTPPWYSNEVHASCCNIAFQSCYISSFPDNMFYHAWTWLLIYHDDVPTTVQVCSFIKPWTVCSNMHEQACQQPCSSWPTQQCSSLQSTGKNKLWVFTCVDGDHFAIMQV